MSRRSTQAVVFLAVAATILFGSEAYGLPDPWNGSPDEVVITPELLSGSGAYVTNDYVKPNHAYTNGNNTANKISNTMRSTGVPEGQKVHIYVQAAGDKFHSKFARGIVWKTYDNPTKAKALCHNWSDSLAFKADCTYQKP